MRWVYLVTVFLSAFLLFQVQPLIGKIILPWFGGAPAVWTTGMLFFQVMLFLGYLYAHLISTRIRPLPHAILHTTVVVAAIALLPVLPDEYWKPSGGGAPTWQILGLLTATVGLQFFLLATSAPLLQVWWTRTNRGEPYRLYALSNAGSLLALVTFPVVFEPNLGSTAQVYVWSASFVLLGGLLIACVWAAWRADPGEQQAESTVAPTAKATPPNVGRRKRKKSKRRLHNAEHAAPKQSENAPPCSWRLRALWVTLSAYGVIMLLAMTNHICQDVAVVPFLWVAPLAVYLLTFILCFGKSSWYHRGWCSGLVIVSIYGCAVFYNSPALPSFQIALAVYLLALFGCCMLCHGELVRLKPPPKYLTDFFLCISFGGAVGGLLVSIVAPNIFAYDYEYPLAIGGCWIILLVMMFCSQSSRLRRGRPLWAWGPLLVVFLQCGVLLSQAVVARSQWLLMTTRNFYGVLSVRVVMDPTDPSNTRYARYQLHHGIIKHGEQYVDVSRRYLPTTYYGPESGVGYAFDLKRDTRDRNIGVVGLGIGTLAAYAREGDQLRFYEINPAVIDIARDVFEYLNHAEKMKAVITIVQGDARLSLESEPNQQFDILAIDAFSSDAIPVHLLTKEAFEIYLGHLKDDGILAVHVSNRYLDLVPLVATLARTHEVEWLHVMQEKDKKNAIHGNVWVLVARRGVLDSINGRENVKPVDVKSIDPWTDDYSNLFRSLR